MLWIRIGFYEDSDPDQAFYLNADPDPEPRSQTNADPCRSCQTLKSLEVNFYMKNIGSQRRYGDGSKHSYDYVGTKAFMKGRKPVNSFNFR